MLIQHDNKLHEFSWNSINFRPTFLSLPVLHQSNCSNQTGHSEMIILLCHSPASLRVFYPKRFCRIGPIGPASKQPKSSTNSIDYRACQNRKQKGLFRIAQNKTNIHTFDQLHSLNYWSVEISFTVLQYHVAHGLLRQLQQYRLFFQQPPRLGQFYKLGFRGQYQFIRD